jgi:hypothetical protein
VSVIVSWSSLDDVWSSIPANEAAGINAFFNSPSVASSINTWSAELSKVTKVLAEIVSSGIPIVPTLFA